MKRDEIYVTKPFLPPLEELMPHLQNIWSAGILTNGGPYHAELERELEKYLGVRHISLFSNGTIALLTALQALQISGEVITTPYSFVATSHALLWNGATPVFVDIDPITLNLDHEKIEAAINPRTTAILPVHCYGRPCAVDEIKIIAKKHNLKVIYDAAHAFGVKHNGNSLLEYGDLSVLSFHATKVFNTFEGGAIISPDYETKIRIDRLKNFGFSGETTVIDPGINGKMNEFSAALGLLQIKYVDRAIEMRKLISNRYCKKLKGVCGIRVPQEIVGVEENYSYFPVIIDDDYRYSRDELYNILRSNSIYARRYFYPLISEFPMYNKLPSAGSENLPIACDIANKVLCLPIYPDLTSADQDRVIEILVN